MNAIAFDGPRACAGTLDKYIPRKGARRLHALIDTFAAAVEVVGFGDDAALEFGRIGTILAERGTPIGELDVLIAAHAASLRCTLVTNNVRHFSKVPGLVLENWK